MGDDVANTLMEHLPPSGWTDVARKSDIDALQKQMDRMNNSMKLLIGSVITVSAAIIVMLAQLQISISQ